MSRTRPPSCPESILGKLETESLEDLDENLPDSAKFWLYMCGILRPILKLILPVTHWDIDNPEGLRRKHQETENFEHTEYIICISICRYSIIVKKLYFNMIMY